ncbi:MAG: hypothetical protein JW760_04835 [Spirochaetales bacterium]|nr:hypothetical protein [Spirochaetales bacterium]
MDRDRLYEIVDFILNQADSSELEAVRLALERRLGKKVDRGRLGIDPRGMAEEAAKTMADQLTWSSEYVRTMVRDFAADIIRRHAPEVKGADMETLLDTWLETKEETDLKLPADLLKTMVRQFIAYATGVMSASEQIALREEIPNWSEVYWKKFPENIRRITSLFLTGKLEEERFLGYLDSLLQAEG